MSQADQCKEALYLKEKDNDVLLNRIAEYENSISSLKHQYNEALRLNVIFSIHLFHDQSELVFFYKAEYLSKADQCKEALYLKEKENDVLLNRIAEYENSISSLKHHYNEALRLNVIFSTHLFSNLSGQVFFKRLNT